MSAPPTRGVNTEVRHSATAQRLYGAEKCLETLRPVLPSGQYSVYEKLIVSSLEQGRMQHA
ncbi:hypothetical protein AC240_12010 [Ralstonia sp. MD27]|nr:hypothetical protein AC240_12010 [Ralstonia sp. MD27]